MRRILAMLIAASFTYGVNASWARTDTVAHWSFEGGVPDTVASGVNSILDSSGNNLHGTPLDGPVYRMMTDSHGSLGLGFDGVNDRVTIADDPLFELTQSLTLEAIIRINSLTGASQMIVVRMDDRGGLDPYQLKVTREGLALFIFDSPTERTSLVSPDSLPLNETVHLAGTLDDATGEMKLYVNGSVSAEKITDQRPIGQLETGRRPGVGR